MKFRQKAALFLATGFYAGNIPFAPGTFGSLIGLPLCFLLAGIKLTAAIFVTVLIVGLAIWIAGTAAKALARKDPGNIVIDEIAGMVVTFTG